MNIIQFKDISKNDVEIVGGKAASLGEMYNAKFPVPPGFAVTADAYKEFIQLSGLQPKIDKILEQTDIEDTTQLTNSSQKIQNLILETDMPLNVRNDIKKTYEHMNVRPEVLLNQKALDFVKAGRDFPFVAVRSSATAEDLPEASFAGQQATYLNVRGVDNVIQAVHQCWASLYTGRAIYYREENGFEHSKVYISVIVQKMVNSEKAGVMFSINPATNNENEIIIEAGFGLGEAVVSGSITPDEYIVDKESLELIKKKINVQEWMIMRDPNVGRNIKRELGERGKKQILNEEEIKVLATMAKKVEEFYGKPQDMEFAIEGNRVYLVQSRPVTTQKRIAKATSGEREKFKGEAILEGMGASPGVASGPVKIVKDMSELGNVVEGDVLVTGMTNPDMVPTMKKAVAIVTDEGGLTSHAAIVSREMGIPAIVGTKEATTKLKDGDIVTVDGAGGKVYGGRAEVESVEIDDTPIDVETITKIKVISDLPEFAEKAAAMNVDGVGLVRLEFMIANGGIWPDQYIKENRKEDYVKLLYDGIGGIAKAFGDKPVWIRNSDMRTDEYTQLKGSEDQPKETDPMIGWHAIRRLLDQPEVLKAEFEAVKRLRDDGIKNVGVMLPFVIDVDEVRKAKELMREIGLEPQKDVQFGVMIETPASCWIIEELCQEGIDFVSFGTNDLTQLTLGIDRNNAKIQKQFNEMHPAVLGEMKKVIETCKKFGVTTSICGQAGSKPEMASFLVRVGIDSISANRDAVNKIKRTVATEEKKLMLEAARR
ncbi:MAG: phosphoenolpyruvate synthase [Candidatus Woesearchaeota archaeon]